MSSREDLQMAIAQIESELESGEREANRTDGRIGNVQDAIVRLTLRETRLQLDMDAATHPDTLYRERLPEDIAVELAGVIGGIAELERLQRGYLRDKEAHRETLRSRKGELERRLDDLAQLGPEKGTP